MTRIHSSGTPGHHLPVPEGYLTPDLPVPAHYLTDVCRTLHPLGIEAAFTFDAFHEGYMPATWWEISFDHTAHVAVRFGIAPYVLGVLDYLGLEARAWLSPSFPAVVMTDVRIRGLEESYCIPPNDGVGCPHCGEVAP